MQELLLLVLLIMGGFCFDSKPTKQQTMLASNYQGKWVKVSGQEIPKDSVFYNFNWKEGDAIVEFTDLGKNTEKIQGMVIMLLNPKYYDQKIIRLIIQFCSPSQEQQTIWQGKLNSYYQIYENTVVTEKGELPISYWVDDQNSAINFVINDNNQISLWLHYSTTTITPTVAIVFTFYAILVFFGTQRPGNILDTNYRHQIIPIILSIAFIFMISIVEIIIGFRSLLGIMNPQAFFVLTGAINMFICIQTLRFYSAIVLRKNILIVFVWLLTISYIWCLLLFRHSYIFFIINSFILLPEIVYHCIRGQKIKSDSKMLLFSISSQFYVLYFKCCPQNIFRESPNYLLGYTLVGLIIFQLSFIRFQIRLGPRFFIPSVLLPHHHNYYQKNKIQTQLKLKKLQCIICLVSMRMEQYNKRKLMITPCNHVFHADCLEEWMTVRMSCPTDRSPLPPF